ncbi:uncharacterized protein E6C27_scaffold670G00080 [Cucumis melo var. makuwa]|uniref:Envelope-like protein n=1 Tax=Cucumis melo var. makuwa TaxID=1194695 RepID=A0A5A7U5D1_CUCMM|nr:uncharacterized protein E6C27_scaffold670G00080 [Cucumis melo var. makuwa]
MDSDDLDDVPLARFLKKTTVPEVTVEILAAPSMPVHSQESSSTKGVFVPTPGISPASNVQPGPLVHSPPFASLPFKPDVAHASVPNNVPCDVSAAFEGRTDVRSDENKVDPSNPNMCSEDVPTNSDDNLAVPPGSLEIPVALKPAKVKIPIALSRFFSSLLLHLTCAVITASDASGPNPKTLSLSYRHIEGSHVSDIDHDVHPSRNLHIFDTSDWDESAEVFFVDQELASQIFNSLTVESRALSNSVNLLSERWRSSSSSRVQVDDVTEACNVWVADDFWLIC